MDRLIAPHTVPFGSHDVAPTSGATGMATDGNPALNIPATIFPAYSFNEATEEIRNAIVRAGIAPSNADWTQLGQAIVALAGAVAGGPYVHLGGGAGQGTNNVFVGWSGANKLKAQVDTTDLGNLAFEPWVSSAIAAEATARNSGDVALNSAIVIEGTARNSGDVALTSSIAAEATARNNADALIYQALNGYMQRASSTGVAQQKYTPTPGVLRNNTLTISAPAINAPASGYFLMVVAAANIGGSGQQPAPCQHYITLDGDGSLASGSVLGWDSVYGPQVACWAGGIAFGTHRLDEQYLHPAGSYTPVSIALNLSYLLIPG